MSTDSRRSLARCLALILVITASACSTRTIPRTAAPTRPPAIIDSPASGDSIPLVRDASRTHPDGDAPLATDFGEATYYADFFHGRTAASGLTFRNDELFAAHRTYSFGTVVRVTNLANQKTVLVLIIDRGPNGTSARARRTIIDVSRRAAEILDFVADGRIPVRVDVLAWGS
jgi:rare lipoprotein A (peptidoglycan hydrolase)